MTKNDKKIILKKDEKTRTALPQKTERNISGEEKKTGIRSGVDRGSQNASGAKFQDLSLTTGVAFRLLPYKTRD